MSSSVVQSRDRPNPSLSGTRSVDYFNPFRQGRPTGIRITGLASSGPAAYQLGNTSSSTITEVMQH